MPSHAHPCTLPEISTRESALVHQPTSHRRCAGGPDCLRAETHGLPAAAPSVPPATITPSPFGPVLYGRIGTPRSPR